LRKNLSDNAPDLHVHSTFSILDGQGTPAQIVERVKELGWRSAALTEHGWLGSVPPFYKACRQNGINPILGCEMYVVPTDVLGVKSNEVRSESYHLTVLALSIEGYFNLVAWNNESHNPDNFYYRPRISVERMIEIAPHPLHHNVVLSGCLGGELCQAILNENGHSEYAAQAYVQSMRSVFPNFYIEFQDHCLPKFMDRGLSSYEDLVHRESEVRKVLITLANETDTPLVLTNDSHFQRPEQRKSHISMMASKMNRWSKGERHQADSQEHQVKTYVRDYGYWTNYMRALEPIAEKYGRAGEKALENARAISSEANIVFDPLDNFSYSIPFSGYQDPISSIRSRCKRRLAELRQTHGSPVVDRFEHELNAMGEFAHYLLFMSDAITYARKQGILTNTRGSAANSVVNYCLGIHDIDPMPGSYDLLFERFFNPERKKLPDIDVDIEADRYLDFMEYVKKRVEENEGENQLVPIGQYGTLANRATFRMVAESLGISKEAQDEISKLLPQMIDSGMLDEESDVYSALKEEYPDLYERASGVFDSIRNVGQHACGWLLGTADRPLSLWTPTYYIASSKTNVTQFNLSSLEDFGLVKGDFLRLKTLAVIKHTLLQLNMDALNLQEIPIDDEATFEMLRKGDTEGIFTLQGNTNRQGCIEVEVNNVHDVIASVAIYRPALTRPGYHRVFNRRRRGEERVNYPSRIAEEVLASTYGLPVFQEQLLQLAKGVGFSDSESQDYLDAIKKAKGVGRGAREMFEKLHPKFVKRAQGVMTKSEAEATWDLVGAFEGYGFNKGHATSYGVLAVRAAYLKCNFPQEFYTSLLDVYPNVGRYVAGARATGFKISRPDINTSTHGYSVGQDDKSIQVGLSAIKHVGPAATNEILRKRPFSSVEDLREKCSSSAVDSRTVTVLGQVGALSALGVRAAQDDDTQIELLGFTLGKPKALNGIKPNYARARTSESWKHLGYVTGLERTEYRTSVSKLFWIPKLEDSKNFKLLELKTSPWAQVKTYLLKAVDVNGILFTIMANEDKDEAAYLRHISKYLRGAAICFDGAIRSPFDRDGPLGFRLYDVTGARVSDPQVWNHEDEKYRAAFTLLSRRKRMRKRG
jgi:DNA polymerase III subunit alpha